MSRVCILTDSTAQFTRPNFPGHELVYVIHFDIQSISRQGNATLPFSATGQQLIAPNTQQFLRYYSQLSREYDAILTIVLSSLLNPAALAAQEAAAQHTNHVAIQVVDSQSIAVGTGLLIQAAAGAASAGASLAETEQLVRVCIPHIYMLVCIPELAYLAKNGYLSYSQAVIGEMLGLLPVFVIEEGRLIPLQKVRTQRHLLESFQEFLDEFSDPQHVALMRGANNKILRTRALREYVADSFPATPFSEHAIGHHLAALVGSQSLGLVIMEKNGKGPR